MYEQLLVVERLYGSACHMTDRQAPAMSIIVPD